MAAVTVGQVALLGRLQVPRAVAGVYTAQHRQSSNLANIRRGRGGRSSFNGHVVTVFGASGFVGAQLINRLGKTGSKIIIPYRTDPYRVQHLKVCSDLGQVQFMQFSLNDEESMRNAMKYSDTVINVINRDYPTKNFSLEDIHVAAPRTIARLCREEGVTNLVHFSHLMASPEPEQLISEEGTAYFKAKYDGEVAVREEFPEAIVFRPSCIYGARDRFLRKYYHIGRGKKSAYRIKFWKEGKETIKMPVFGSDVVAGVLAAIGTPEARGQTYEVVGPDSFYIYDLVKFFYYCMRRPLEGFEDFTPVNLMRMRYLDPVNPWSLYKLQNLYTLEQECLSDKTTGLPTLEDLGVKLTRIQDRARHEFKTTRVDRYYDEELGQYADYPDPPTVAESMITLYGKENVVDTDVNMRR